MMCLRVLASLFLALGSMSAFAHAAPVAPLAAPVEDSLAQLAGRVDRVFRRYDRTDGPGCAVGVYRDGELVLAKGYGMADLEHDVPIAADTVFYIGSTSKQFVSACIVLLAEEGKLSLDDEVRKYIPEFPDYGTPVTIRQLVHHTSGIRDYLELWRLAGRDYLDHIPEAAVLEMICAQSELNFEPGERHLYSNSCYFLLGVIVERASGKRLRQYAEENVFRPLGMTKTHFHDDPGFIIEDRAFGYAPTEDGSGFRSLLMRFALVGSGGLYTTVEDLQHWVANFDDNRLGKASPSFVETMHTKGRLRSGEEVGYAFALIHGEHRGMATVHHGGALGGYRAQLLRFPDQRLAVAVLSNQAGFDVDTYAMRVAEIFLPDDLAAGGRAKETSSESTAEATREDSKNEPAAVTLDAAILRRYAGRYEVQPGFVVEVIFEDGRLFADVPGQERARLIPSSRTDFFVPDDDARIRFVEDSAGQVERMLVKADGATTPAKRLTDDVVEPVGAEGLAGIFSSAELGVTYRVMTAGEDVVLRAGYSEIATLMPVAPRVYRGSGVTLHVRETRDGRATAFTLDTGRVKGLAFRRL